MDNFDSSSIEIGRLLRAGIKDFVAGCKVSLSGQPFYGAMVAAPQEDGYQIYGLIQEFNRRFLGLVNMFALRPDLIGAKVGEHLFEHQLIFAERKIHAVPPLDP